MATRLIEPSTSRLVLRQWHESDRAPFAALNADPLVMEHFPTLLKRQIASRPDSTKWSPSRRSATNVRSRWCDASAWHAIPMETSTTLVW